MITYVSLALNLFIIVFYLSIKANNEVTKRLFKNKINNVIFKEIQDLGKVSLMLRTDINIYILIPKSELEKHYEIVY